MLPFICTRDVLLYDRRCVPSHRQQYCVRSRSYICSYVCIPQFVLVCELGVSGYCVKRGGKCRNVPLLLFWHLRCDCLESSLQRSGPPRRVAIQRFRTTFMIVAIRATHTLHEHAQAFLSFSGFPTNNKYAPILYVVQFIFLSLPSPLFLSGSSSSSSSRAA